MLPCVEVELPELGFEVVVPVVDPVGVVLVVLPVEVVDVPVVVPVCVVVVD